MVWSNNEANREIPSPSEVREMMGAAPARAPVPLWVDMDGIRVAAFQHTREVFLGEDGNQVLRCYSCGRAYECACGDDCEYCEDGEPKRGER